MGEMKLRLWITAVFLTSRVDVFNAATQNCHGEYSVSGMFLKGHTFKTVAVDLPIKCHVICSQDVRCQSYNVIIGRHICELNNRTKEARPEDFVHDFKRFYMTRTFNRGIEVFSKMLRILHEIRYSIDSKVKQFAALGIT